MNLQISLDLNSLTNTWRALAFGSIFQNISNIHGSGLKVLLVMNQLLPLILDYQSKCQDNKTINSGRNVKTDFKIFVHCWEKKVSFS